MHSLAERLAARYLQADEGEGDTGKGGVPARWNEWLDAVHQGGRAKVPNPSAETRSRYPNVSFSTALKDKAFFSDAMKDYREWAKKNPEKGKGGEKPAAKPEEAPAKTPEKKDAPKPEKAEKKEEKPDRDVKPEKKSATPFSGALGPDEAAIDAVLKEHDAAVEKLRPAMDKAVKSYEKGLKDQIKTRPHLKAKLKEWQAKSEGEKLLHAAGHEIGTYFQDKVLSKSERETHDRVMEAWQASSAATESQKLHGLAKSLGVKGYPSPQDEKDKATEKDRKAGAGDEELKAYAAKAYAFTQAMLKKLGVKELTIYRGVSGMIDKSPPAVGDPVEIKTREMSSFTTDPSRATAFGRAIEYKLPASQVFSSSLTFPKFAPHGSYKDALGEAEIVVLGASASKGKVTGEPR